MNNTVYKLDFMLNKTRGSFIFICILVGYLLISAINDKHFLFLAIATFFMMERVSMWVCANNKKWKWLFFAFIFPITLYIFSSQIL